MDHPWRSNKRQFDGKTEERGRVFLKGVEERPTRRDLVVIRLILRHGLKCNDISYLIVIFAEFERYINDHRLSLCHSKQRKWASFQSHNKDFVDWFHERADEKIQQGHHILDHVKWLSLGPSQIVQRYTGESINGYKFHTLKRDANSVTDNNGVSLIAETTSFSSRDKNPIVREISYYGSIEEIIEVHYPKGKFSFMLFKCVWFHVEKNGNGLIRVNCKKCICKEEPFILASQAHQMGKRIKCEFYGAANLTEYEKDRLKRLASNKQRILAVGFTTCLASKTIFYPKAYDYEKAVEGWSDQEESDYERDEEHNSEEDRVAVKKKAQRVLPGSMSLYSKMRQKQQHAKSTTGGMEMHHNEEYYDEQEDEQGSDDHVNNIRASPLRAFSSNTNKVAEDFPMLANENEFQKETQQLVTTTTKKASTIKKTRGPTVMVEVHNRKFEGRPVIVLNEYGQPIGTTKEVCGELSRFLGTIARDSKLAPLNYCDWTSLPSKFKEKMWDYILEKYMIPGDGQ
uniref:DUF4216 domain-containing protein n=1 Tax=Chenopodium quinoa TaxID=63459 RepID=A0A803MYI4_CHEQI